MGSHSYPHRTHIGETLKKVTFCITPACTNPVVAQRFEHRVRGGSHEHHHTGGCASDVLAPSPLALFWILLHSDKEVY